MSKIQSSSVKRDRPDAGLMGRGNSGFGAITNPGSAGVGADGSDWGILSAYGLESWLLVLGKIFHILDERMITDPEMMISDACKISFTRNRNSRCY